MKTKIAYSSPAIEIVFLDNEISLTLDSNPPFGPNESRNVMTSPTPFDKDPLKTDFT